MPVVVLHDVKNAVPTANAMSDGGVDVMEITFRTEAAPECIKAVSENCPDVLVGAGTIVSLEQCMLAAEMGAKFIVSPGFDKKIVKWCMENDIFVCPGCVTPTEIMKALKCGLKTIKFFPSNVYGGVKGMKTLAAPFGGVNFIATGGVNTDNIKEYISSPFVHAVGGSWVCPEEDINAGNFEKITNLCAAARAAAID